MTADEAYEMQLPRIKAEIDREFTYTLAQIKQLVAETAIPHLRTATLYTETAVKLRALGYRVEEATCKDGLYTSGFIYWGV